MTSPQRPMGNHEMLQRGRAWIECGAGAATLANAERSLPSPHRHIKNLSRASVLPSASQSWTMAWADVAKT